MRYRTEGSSELLDLTMMTYSICTVQETVGDTQDGKGIQKAWERGQTNIWTEKTSSNV